MSRTKKGSKRPGYEYWTARPLGCSGAIGRWVKKLTHKIERMRGKAQTRKMVGE